MFSFSPINQNLLCYLKEVLKNMLSGQICGDVVILRCWHLSTVTQTQSLEHNDYLILDWCPQTLPEYLFLKQEGKKWFRWLICSYTVSNCIYSSNLLYLNMSMWCKETPIWRKYKCQPTHYKPCATPNNAVQLFHFIAFDVQDILA